MQMIWSAALGDACPPLPAPLPPSPPPSSRLHRSPSSPQEKCFSALPAAFVQKVIYFSCCWPVCYLTALPAAPFSPTAVVAHLLAWAVGGPHFLILYNGR